MPNKHRSLDVATHGALGVDVLRRVALGLCVHLRAQTLYQPPVGETKDTRPTAYSPQPWVADRWLAELPAV
eukprot:COSAG02_NODE_1282_length_13471_cov_56.770790_7_plen_71_part_00